MQKNKPETFTFASMSSPVGDLILVASDRGLVSILLPSKKGDPAPSRLTRAFPGSTIREGSPQLEEAIRQLRDYFAGTRRTFDIPLDLRGTDFQMRVWRAVAQIPFGRTQSYGDIARLICKPKACRAVGAANRANPLPIVIPCHRVIGSNGSLTGYAGGLSVKQALLDLERK